MAVTWRVSVMVSAQSSIPVQAPLQPTKLESGSVTAVRVTVVVVEYICAQSNPQSIPGGLLVTVPLPSPSLFTNRKISPLNFSVTVSKAPE